MINRVVYGRSADTILHNDIYMWIIRPEQELCRASFCLLTRLCLKYMIEQFPAILNTIKILDVQYFTKISNDVMLQFCKCNKFQFMNNGRRSVCDRIFLKGICPCEQNLCDFVHPTLPFRLVCT